MKEIVENMGFFCFSFFFLKASVFKVLHSVSAAVFINNRKSEAQGKKKKKSKKQTRS